MKRLLLAMTLGFLCMVGPTGCSDSTGADCTAVRVPLEAVFFTQDGITFEYGHAYRNMMAAGGTCVIRSVEGYIQGGIPWEKRDYACVVCKEAYNENAG